MPKIITLEEVSERTRIPLATLRYYRATKQGPKMFKLGGRIVAYESDVDGWIENAYRASDGSSAA